MRGGVEPHRQRSLAEITLAQLFWNAVPFFGDVSAEGNERSPAGIATTQAFRGESTP